MPIHQRYHLFLSYARVDNQPCETGWVTTFKQELEARHRRYSGRRLEIFFDTEAIEESIDWRTRLRAGIRDCQLFLAFLSPNYITSDNCLWEWEEYLRLEHSAARGSDGLTPIFFVHPRDLAPAAGQAIEAWLAEIHGRYPWFQPRPLKPGLAGRLQSFTADLDRRNRTGNLSYPAWVELQPWFERGPEILRELDAGTRSAEVTARVSGVHAGVESLSLADRLDNLDRHICRRLDRIALADAAPHNVSQAHLHFVGRHRELRQLHETLVAGGAQTGGRGSGGRGIIAAAHSPGGMGKTALARQYCHAYAEFYAAGGTWEIHCEGVTTLGAALMKLAEDPDFQRMGAREGLVLELSEVQRNNPSLSARSVLSYLREVTVRLRGPRLGEILAGLEGRHSPAEDIQTIARPRALLLFDNVDHPALFSQQQAALLPAEEWLEILVTTRLDPSRFGTGDARWQTALEIEPLPEADALDLIRDFQPGSRFENDAEEEAARRIVSSLGGYTLAIELVSAYLGTTAEAGVRPSNVEERFAAEGLLRVVDAVGAAGEVAEQIRHQQKQVRSVLQWSLNRLTEPARNTLELAALMSPDCIPLDWLEEMTRLRCPGVMAEKKGYPSPWRSVWQEIYGLRLLHPQLDSGAADLRGQRESAVWRVHRLVSDHVAQEDSHLEAAAEVLESFIRAKVFHYQGASVAGKEPWPHHEWEWLIRNVEFLLGRIGGDDNRTLGDIHRIWTWTHFLEIVSLLAMWEARNRSFDRGLSMMRVVHDHLGGAWSRSKDLGAEGIVLAKLGGVISAMAELLILRGNSGDKDEANVAMNAAAKSMAFVLEALPQDPNVLYNAAVFFFKRGFLRTDADPKFEREAHQDFSKSLELLERITKADEHPSWVPQALRAARVVQQAFAGRLLAGGQGDDVARARAMLEECGHYYESQYEENPGSSVHARDLAVFMVSRARLHASQGLSTRRNLHEAVQYQEQALLMFGRLRDRSTELVQPARDWVGACEELLDYYELLDTEIHDSRALALCDEWLACLARLDKFGFLPGMAGRDKEACLTRRDRIQQRAANRNH